MRRLLSHDMRPEVAIRTRSIAFVTNLLRQIENDRDRKGVKLACDGDQRFAGFGLDVSRVDDSETSCGKTFAGYEVKDVEGILCGRLIVFII